jgi:hypothetical protein
MTAASQFCVALTRPQSVRHTHTLTLTRTRTRTMVQKRPRSGVILARLGRTTELNRTPINENTFTFVRFGRSISRIDQAAHSTSDRSPLLYSSLLFSTLLSSALQSDHPGEVNVNGPDTDEQMQRACALGRRLVRIATRPSEAAEKQSVQVIRYQSVERVRCH